MADQNVGKMTGLAVPKGQKLKPWPVKPGWSRFMPEGANEDLVWQTDQRLNMVDNTPPPGWTETDSQNAGQYGPDSPTGIKYNPSTGQPEYDASRDPHGVGVGAGRELDARAKLANRDPFNPSTDPLDWVKALGQEDLTAPGPYAGELEGARDRFKDVWSDDAAMLEYLQRRAMGADSLVEREAQQAHNQLLTDQASQLASMRGGYNPAAARQAQYLAAQNSQKLAGDVYTNKLREQQLAQDAYLKAIAAKQGMAAGMFGQESNSLGRDQQFDLARRKLRQDWYGTGFPYKKLGTDAAIAGKNQELQLILNDRNMDFKNRVQDEDVLRNRLGLAGSIVQGAAPLVGKIASAAGGAPSDDDVKRATEWGDDEEALRRWP